MKLANTSSILSKQEPTASVEFIGLEIIICDEPNNPDSDDGNDSSLSDDSSCNSVRELVEMLFGTPSDLFERDSVSDDHDKSQDIVFPNDSDSFANDSIALMKMKIARQRRYETEPKDTLPVKVMDLKLQSFENISHGSSDAVATLDIVAMRIPKRIVNSAA
jgi:hypothetical protein